MGRIRKTHTRENVKIALAQLLAEKEYEAITVVELADRAGINRKTFYNNYTGIHMAVEELAREIMDDFDKALSDIDFRGLMDNPDVVFINVGHLLQEKLLLYESLLRIPQQSLVYAKMFTVLKERIMDVFRDTMNESLFEMVVDYHLTGIVFAYKTWIDKEMKEDIDELSKRLSLLVMHGVCGMIAKEK